MTEQLDLEELKTLSQEQLQDRLIQLNEEKNKLRSDTERGAQKIIEEKKLAERSLKAIKELNGDSQKLVELYENDPKLGKYILDTMYDGIGIESFRAGDEQPKLAKETFEEMYQSKQVEERLEKVTSKLNTEVKEKFDAEFAEITEGKKLTKDNIDKYIKMTLREVEPDYTSKEMEAKLFSTGGGVAKPKDDSKKGDKATSDFLQQMGVIRKG